MVKKGDNKENLQVTATTTVKKAKKNTAFVDPVLIEGSVKIEAPKEIAASDYYEESVTNFGGRGADVRRSRAATISRSERYANIEGGVVPFIYSGGRGTYTSNISIRDAIILCQKAYYNFAVFRNTIDLMTEFSASQLYFTGGNAQSRKFFEAWASRVNLWRLQDDFYREYYRSGNVFLYKLNATFRKEDVSVISDIIEASAEKDIPIKYIILNPADIQSIGSASFLAPRYIKVLNDFEMQVLTNPKNDDEKKIAEKIKDFGTLRDNVKVSQSNAYMVFYLDPDKVKGVFYKKQPYEPFGVPMGFPVLQDLNWKQELKNIDMAISRTVQQAVLLVTIGSDEVGMPTPKQINALKQIFQNESIGRILVTDYTTKAAFVIPEIDKILDPKKYEIVNRDIKEGLNNILIGDDKYANSNTKIEMFLARLKHARETFLNEFLIPEINEIGKELGFKSIPSPRLKDSDFRDDPNLARIYSRMAEIGVLTPEEMVTALETGRLPLPEESLESQKKLHQYHEQGLYQPLLNNPNLTVPQTGEEGLGQLPLSLPPKVGGGGGFAGRPPGSGGPKTVNNIGQPGKISAAEVAMNLSRFELLEGSIGNYLKEKFNRKRLSKDQRAVVKEIAETIAINETPEKWLESIATYVSQPVTVSENFNIVNEIAEKHGVDIKTAALLMHSQVKED